ncbi:MAG: nitronate monooxygenase [Bacillota bacterium]
MTLKGLQIGEKRARYCIVQGGMSIRISLAPLAAAVANEGGVGTIGGMGIPPAELQMHIREAKLRTSGVVGVNLMYVGSLFDHLLDVCVRERVDFVAIGAGLARGPFQKLHNHGIPGLAIISSTKAARIVAQTQGVSGVIVESGQAGGHLGPKDPEVSTWDLFPDVLRELRATGFQGPVIAAGGILHYADVEKALAMGADGVQLGTRFAMSDESSASPEMKMAWVNATGSQVEWWSPTGYASRAIIPHSDIDLPRIDGVTTRCNGCLKICMHRENKDLSHCISRALINSQSGNVKHGLVFAGARVGEITDIIPVKEIFKRLTC